MVDSQTDTSSSLTILILAAGMGSRYGGLKQMDPMGPSGETVLDYSVFDALRAGFNRVVFVIRRDFEQAFREQIASRFEDRVQVDFAFQDLHDLPEGFRVPEGREKPWGTAHAVRAAREQISGPFAMINADDFYGRDSYAKLASFLRSAPAGGPVAQFAMVGFRLANTLSEHGSVARGVCRQDGSGKLLSVTEMTKIFRTSEGAENREDEANPVKLSGEDLVSMNMWGFTADLMPLLEEKMTEFLRAHGHELKSESYIPSVVDELVCEGRASVSVLPTASDWFGVTYREDKPRVAKAIGSLIAEGSYPADLWNS